MVKDYTRPARHEILMREPEQNKAIRNHAAFPRQASFVKSSSRQEPTRTPTPVPASNSTRPLPMRLRRGRRNQHPACCSQPDETTKEGKEVSAGLAAELLYEAPCTRGRLMSTVHDTQTLYRLASSLRSLWAVPVSLWTERVFFNTEYRFARSTGN